MLRPALFVVIALALVTAPGCTRGPKSPQSGQSSHGEDGEVQAGAKSQWYAPAAGPSDLEDAAKKGVPVVAKIGSDTCEPCRRMEPVMAELGDYYSGKVLFMTIDVYRYQALAGKYNVQVIPTLLFLDSKGEAVAYAQGYHTVDQMKTLIDRSGILK